MAKKKSKEKSKKSKGFDYRTTSAYKSLTNDEKKLADLQYQVQTGNSKYSARQLKDALKKAKKDSKGYMKQVLREFETSVSQQVASETGDYQSHLDTINENIKEINEDLATNKEYYSLEEQRVLAQQAKDYEQTRGQLVNQISATGTTFSSIGEQQKGYAESTQKGMVESTTAKYNKQISDLEIAASRGNIQAQQQLKDLQRTHQENIAKLGLTAESYLGTEKAKGLNIPGYTTIGDISGQFKEESVKDIAARQGTYLDKAKMTSLNF